MGIEREREREMEKREGINDRGHASGMWWVISGLYILHPCPPESPLRLLIIIPYPLFGVLPFCPRLLLLCGVERNFQSPRKIISFSFFDHALSKWLK
jgi:hypothetical protein